MLWGCLVFLLSVSFVVSISSMSSLNFIWYVWVLKGYFLSCGLHGAWNVWNKFVGFGFWIWSILLKRCDLNSRVSILDGVLFMQFDVLGRQVKDLVLVWFCGFGMWLTTEQNVLVAWTRGLWLVSINQSQTGYLEKLRVFFLEIKEKIFGTDIVFRSLHRLYIYIYISV